MKLTERLESYVEDEEQRVKSLRMYKKRLRELQIQGMKELLNRVRELGHNPTNKTDEATPPIMLGDP